MPPDTAATAAPPPSPDTPTRVARRRVAGAAHVAEASGTELLRKPVNTLAIVPKSTRITTLARKGYNVLLYEAQEQGLEQDVFRAPLERIIKVLDYASNDHELVKKHLRAMVSTTVEWQSPTTGEGASWNVSGLLAHARLSKERGQVWVEWSYAVNLKQELLKPTVFARLRLEIISQLRSHAAIALYEICTRYKDVGRTARQKWRWWQPVLTGNPQTDRAERQEYRIFKRDTLRLAVAEVNAITDIEVALVEHKQGRFIDEIQFTIQPKAQTSLLLGQPPKPVDLGLIERAGRLGIPHEAAEDLSEKHGEAALRTALEALQRRAASAFPEPLRDPLRYLRALMPAEAAKAEKRDTAQAAEAAEAAQRDDPLSPAAREQQAKRQARWLAEWVSRRREGVAAELSDLSGGAQEELVQGLLQDLDTRQVHPSIRKRLTTSGWQHPMVRGEMIRYYAKAAYGDMWDQPSAEQLLAIAAELADEPVGR